MKTDKPGHTRTNTYLKMQLENDFTNVGNITNAKSFIIADEISDNQIQDKPYIKTETEDDKFNKNI